MGNKKKQQSYDAAYRESENVSSSYDPQREAANARANEISAGLGGSRDELAGGYRQMMEDPRDIIARQVQAQNVNFERIADPRSIDRGRLPEIADQYKTWRDTGGLTAENIDRMRGMGGYDEFAKTGGYTPEQIANIKAQAISPIGSYATGARDELTRRRALQGGYAPGFDAASRNINREAARGIADTSLNANVAIQEKVNEGRRWGIGGIAESERAISDMRTRNQLAALQGEGDIAKALSDLDAQDIRNLMETGMFNSEGELKAAIANQQANLEAGIYNSQSEFAANKFNLTNAQDQYARGMEGLGGLYEGDIKREQAERDRALEIQAQEDNSRAEYQRIAAGLGSAPGNTGNYVSAAGTGAGILSEYFKKNPSIPGTAASTAGTGITGGGITGGTAMAGTGGLVNWGGSGLTAGLSQGAPGAIASQGVSGTVAGGTGTSAGIGGGLATAGAIAAPAAAGILAYGIGERGWGRGGMEGAYVNPSRDRITANYGGSYEGMVNSLAERGITGPAAEKLISDVYNAKTMPEIQQAELNLRRTGAGIGGLDASATPQQQRLNDLARQGITERTNAGAYHQAQIDYLQQTNPELVPQYMRSVEGWRRQHPEWFA